MKSKKKSSVLKRQKPKRGRKKPLAARLKLYGGLTALALGVAAGAYTVYTFKTKGVFVADGPDKIDWKVTLKTNDPDPLPEKAAENVIAAVKRHAGDGSKKSLAQAAEAVQKLDSYAQVSLIKLSPSELAVHVKRRVPTLCVVADRLRFVAADGVVFGTPDNASECPGPTLTGAFEERRKFVMKGDHTLQLENEERAVLKEAVELLRLAKEKKHAFAQVDYRRYRGFFVTLEGSGAGVAIGRAPFSAKLDKLQTILAKLQAKGQVAERIELDYQGKAFIKSKKM
jgi:cell division septal protein FtsQ